MKISPTMRGWKTLAHTPLYLLAAILLSACATTSADVPSIDPMGKQLAAAIKDLDTYYVPGTIQTRDVSQAALKQVSVNEAALQDWYVHSEQACYDKFFVNSCLTDIKLYRREYRMKLQRIEIEAKALQRKLHIDELDEDLKRRQAQKP
ncbi:hypothetical protein [Undibacterium terreum]|uniref:Lipoprotein n=1 Tax=Undibacterium terreum TaxID=1224302 RepID=A0A916UXI1_9BURK|nr:hypothetical protein [Undibacterium terreum]GGC92744.1 hypothetical protein GCM10011396_45030 [Undibacterium terreum]